MQPVTNLQPLRGLDSLGLVRFRYPHINELGDATVTLQHMAGQMTSESEQQYCTCCVQAGVRIDGRSPSDFRPVELELGLIAQANGSARLHLGATDVLVGIKVEVGSPDVAEPDCGRVQVTVECSSCASPDYEGRGGDSWGSQLAYALENSLKPLKPTQGYGIDLRKLNLITGKRCWNLYIDALVLNDDGNVLDALSLACLAALSNTRIPAVELVEGEDGQEIELDDDVDKCQKLELHGVPIIVSVSKIGNTSVLDLNLQEEACASVTLHVAVDSKGRNCGVTKEGSIGIDPSTMLAMLESVQGFGPKLISSVQKFVTTQGRAEGTS